MFESIREFWIDVWEIRLAQWIVFLAGLAIVILVALYIVRFFREMAFGSDPDPIDHLSEFERMRNAGQLDDQEFQRLKSTLAKPPVDPLVTGESETLDERT